MHGRGPKLGIYVPLLSFNKLISEIFEKNSIFMAENVPKMAKISEACGSVCTFLPIKSIIFFFKSLGSV